MTNEALANGVGVIFYYWVELTHRNGARIGHAASEAIWIKYNDWNPQISISSAGYQAVWGVAHALHTPLMSVTNAISGCTVACLQETEETFIFLFQFVRVFHFQDG